MLADKLLGTKWAEALGDSDFFPQRTEATSHVKSSPPTLHLAALIWFYSSFLQTL